MALRKLPEAFGLTASKSWYLHYFNTQANLNYVRAIPGIEHYDVDQMNESELKEFMAWYDAQKDKVFDNRRVATILSGRRDCSTSGVPDISQISWRSKTLMCF